MTNELYVNAIEKMYVPSYHYDRERGRRTAVLPDKTRDDGTSAVAGRLELDKERALGTFITFLPTSRTYFTMLVSK